MILPCNVGNVNFQNIYIYLKIQPEIIKKLSPGENTIAIKQIYHNYACNRYCEVQKVEILRDQP